ncbi:MAG: dockerin type I domain-containing protein [Candidatus Zixiibacteriota bacterium]
MKTPIKIVCLILVAFSGHFLCQPVYGQGSIFGTVTNSDMTIPDAGQLHFFGYLNGTDDEIRLESCVGAGYDGGFWFDDFQNYMAAAAAGNPYNYHFFNIANLEGFVLSDIIPSNSYQQENIQLESLTWPLAPTGFAGQAQADSTVYIHWTPQENTTYRIYRRVQPSEGSFFRIDNPAGALSDPGIADSFYIDNQVDNVSSYDYVLIPVKDGIPGTHSAIITVNSRPILFVCGDADGNGLVNILDGFFIIQYLYKNGPEPVPLEAADMDGRPGINLLDYTYVISFLYRSGPPPNCPE